MDQIARIARLRELVSGQQSMQERLATHRDKLPVHHVSRERDRALLHAEESIRRGEKLQRSLDRALRSEDRQHSRAPVSRRGKV